MSSVALKWFGTVTGLKPIQNVLLRSLCAFHTTRHGCFPSQLRLAKEVGVTCSTINLHLKVLEKKGLIARVKKRDPKTRRQRPTYYVLGFELEAGNRKGLGAMDGASEPGDGYQADSEIATEPTPIFGENRLRILERKALKETINLTVGEDMFSATSSSEEFFLMAYSHLVRGPTPAIKWPRPISWKQKGEADGLERQARYGFPEFNQMVERDRDRKRVRVDAWVAGATGLCVVIDRCSREADTWEAEHARRGWPWFRNLESASKFYVPAVGIDALDDFIARLLEVMQ